MRNDNKTAKFVQLLFVWVVGNVQCASFPPSARRNLPIAINKITEIVTSCDSTSLNITISMEQPFKGILFSKEFSQECRVFGTMKNSVSVNLPTSGCGVRLSKATDDLIGKEKKMIYSVNLVVQQDKHLRQITDQERIVKCIVDTNAFNVKSKPMEDALKNDILEKKDHRTGRMKDEGWSKAIHPDIELSEALRASKAWMEIVPIEEDENALLVGEQALLMVKSTLPVGIGWKVVDCLAHDGLGDASQKLLDEDGCPVDEGLLPELLKGPVRPISMMRHQEAVAKFVAFKFPDRDRLHLSCGLQLCRQNCQLFDCGNITRSGRRIIESGEEGEVLDRLEVFNSVEVLAPGIELDERENDKLAGDPLRATFGYIPGDRTFCVSPDKMALTFCVLGLIFLCAVIVAAFALYKARQSGSPMPYYTRSLFSSSSDSGNGSAYGSKLLLQDSPCMGQSAASMRDPSRAKFGYIPEDRTFCVSPDKMALTFCVLGLIFLCAVIVVAFALYKARRSGSPMPYYTRSLFSSSSDSGNGSAYGSKL